MLLFKTSLKTFIGTLPNFKGKKEQFVILPVIIGTLGILLLFFSHNYFWYLLILLIWAPTILSFLFIFGYLILRLIYIVIVWSSTPNILSRFLVSLIFSFKVCAVVHTLAYFQVLNLYQFQILILGSAFCDDVHPSSLTLEDEKGSRWLRYVTLVSSFLFLGYKYYGSLQLGLISLGLLSAQSLEVGEVVKLPEIIKPMAVVHIVELPEPKSLDPIILLNKLHAFKFKAVAASSLAPTVPLIPVTVQDMALLSPPVVALLSPPVVALPLPSPFPIIHSPMELVAFYSQQYASNPGLVPLEFVAAKAYILLDNDYEMINLLKANVDLIRSTASGREEFDIFSSKLLQQTKEHLVMLDGAQNQAVSKHLSFNSQFYVSSITPEAKAILKMDCAFDVKKEIEQYTNLLRQAR